MFRSVADYSYDGDSIKDSIKGIHPNLGGVLGDLKMIDDISNGLKNCKEDYLPIEIDEDNEEYHDRLNRVGFKNFLGPLINGYAGLLTFEVENAFDGLEVDNVDLRGSSLQAFFLMATKRALKDRYCGVFIEAPANSGTFRNNREILQSSARPWMNLVLRSNIRNWREAIIGNERVFQMVVLREPRWVQVGDYGMELKEYYRVLEVQNVSIESEPIGTRVTYRVVEVNEDGLEIPVMDEEGVPEEGLYPNLSKIPLVIFDAGLDPGEDDLTILSGRPPFIEYAEANIEHHKLRSERRESLHKTGQVMLMRSWPGVPPEESPRVKMGSHYTLEVSAGGEAKYLEVEGKGIAAQTVAIKELEEALSDASVSVLTGQTPMETVVAAMLKSAQGTSNIKAMSTSLNSVLTSCLDFYAAYLGQENNSIINVNDEVLTAPAEPSRLELVRDLHTVDGVIDRETMLRTLKSMKGLPEEFDLDEVEGKGVAPVDRPVGF